MDNSSAVGSTVTSFSSQSTTEEPKTVVQAKTEVEALDVLKQLNDAGYNTAQNNAALEGKSVTTISVPPKKEESKKGEEDKPWVPPKLSIKTKEDRDAFLSLEAKRYDMSKELFTLSKEEFLAKYTFAESAINEENYEMIKLQLEMKRLLELQEMVSTVVGSANKSIRDLMNK